MCLYTHAITHMWTSEYTLLDLGDWTWNIRLDSSCVPYGAIALELHF